MATHAPHEASAALAKVANAITVLEKALDKLWPRLPLDVVLRLPGELEHFNTSLANRVQAIADDIECEAADEDAAVRAA